MKMTEQEEQLVERAVATLKGAPAPELPAGFMLRFEENLKAEKVTQIRVVSSPELPHEQPNWSRTLAAAIFMLCCLAALYLIHPGFPENNPTGFVLTASEGSVLLDGRDVSAATSLLQSQTLVTEGQKALLLSKDNLNKIVVGSNSKVALHSTDSTTRAELELTSGSVSITEQSLKIAVRTPELVVSPVGTDYRVDRGQNVTHVSVSSGQVRLSTPHSSGSVVLNAGESVSWNHNRPLKKAEVEKISRAQRSSLDADIGWANSVERVPSLGRPFPKSEWKARPDYPKAKPRPSVQPTPTIQNRTVPPRRAVRPSQTVGNPNPPRTRPVRRPRKPRVGTNPNQQRVQRRARAGNATRPGQARRQPRNQVRPNLGRPGAYPKNRPRRSPVNRPGTNPSVGSRTPNNKPGQVRRPGQSQVRPGRPQINMKRPGSTQRRMPGTLPGKRPNGVNAGSTVRNSPPGMNTRPSTGDSVRRRGNQSTRPGMQREPGSINRTGNRRRGTRRAGTRR